MRLSGVMTLAGVVAAGLACSGALEPGALTIVLDADPPEVTNATNVTLAGQVTRSPAADDVVIVVTVTGAGTSLSDTADASNRFTFTVALTQNTQNQIQLSATDESGSSGTPLSVTVVHDGVGPAVTTFSPTHQADGVTPSTVTVTLSEPAGIQSGSGVSVLRLGAQVAGAVTMSADSLTLTFTPTAPFVTNAIHTIVAGGLRDAIGNLGQGASACFVTPGVGVSLADPPDDVWVAGSPQGTLVPIDISQVRLARGGGELRGMVQFTTPRSLSPASPSNVAAALDFDTDQDGSTGFVTVKDSVFSGTLTPSGARAESAVWILPSSGTSGARVYTGDFQFNITFPLVPDLCGTLVGFGVPESSLGVESGAFRLVAYAEAGDSDGIYADPAPEDGFHTVVLTAPPAIATVQPTLLVPGSATTRPDMVRGFHWFPALRRLR